MTQKSVNSVYGELVVIHDLTRNLWKIRFIHIFAKQPRGYKSHASAIVKWLKSFGVNDVKVNQVRIAEKSVQSAKGDLQFDHRTVKGKWVIKFVSKYPKLPRHARQHVPAIHNWLINQGVTDISMDIIRSTIVSQQMPT